MKSQRLFPLHHPPDPAARNFKLALRGSVPEEREEFRALLDKIDTHRRNTRYLSQISGPRFELEDTAQLADSRARNNGASGATTKRSVEKVQLEKLAMKQKRLRNNFRQETDASGLRTKTPSHETHELYEKFKQRMRLLNEKQSEKQETQLVLKQDLGVKLSYDEANVERMELKRFLKYEKEKLFSIEKVA